MFSDRNCSVDPGGERFLVLTREDPRDGTDRVGVVVDRFDERRRLH